MLYVVAFSDKVTLVTSTLLEKTQHNMELKRKQMEQALVPVTKKTKTDLVAYGNRAKSFPQVRRKYFSLDPFLSPYCTVPRVVTEINGQGCY